ncbi:MAG: TRAP transporter substrate-binding protein, partial [Deltaproteobacteria bacterium]|nr:TRAP transporter substrate-binding protein [Deltaproteobacteria bacterium]
SYGIQAKKFKELAEKYTNGSVQVKLRCCGQVGGEDEAFKSLQLGTIDAYIITSNNVSPHFPLMDVFVLPYIFQGTAHAVKVLDGQIGHQIADKIYKEAGVHLVTYGYFEFRDAYNTKRPINQMADLSGLKIRVPKNNIMIKTWKAFGAEPVPLAWSEMSTALQTGTVDGGDNGTSVIESQKFYDSAKHLFILEHFCSFSPTFFSERFMKKLDETQKEAVLKAIKEAGLYQRETMSNAIDKIRGNLVRHGMLMTKPDKTLFIKASAKIQDDFAKEKGGEYSDLLEKIRQTAK